MIIDSNSFSEGQQIDSNVCIVGGGPAGIVLAIELAKYMDGVLLLESGAEFYEQSAQELYSPASPPKNGYPDPTYSRMRYLGGSSNHWENNTSMLDPIDFEKREWVADSGWPIKYEEVDKFYSEAAVYCGTQNDGYELDKWLETFNVSDILAGSNFIDTGIAKAAIPPIRFFNSHGNTLKLSKRITVNTHSNLVDIEFSKEKGEVTGLFYKSGNNQEIAHKVRAKKYIFAMGGIENARMLLLFNRKYNDLLGNQGDNVGRYFMDHPVVRGGLFYANNDSIFNLYKGANFPHKRVLGFFKLTRKKQLEKQVMNLRIPLVSQSNYTVSDGISSFHILKKSISEGEIPDNFGSHLSNFVSDIDMVIEAVSRKTFDQKVFDHADEFGGYQLPAMMEQAPYRDNRILLSDSKDRYAIPRIQIDWRIKQQDKDQFWKALGLAAQGVGALSLGRIRLLKEREDRIWDSQLGFGHHHMGTTRMSDTPVKGVVNKELKVFGTRNLYIAGSSVFPTGGHVPPTLTIVALTIRLAKTIAREFVND